MLNKYLIGIIALTSLALVFSCEPETTISTESQEVNPAAEGFNAAHSDPKAIAIADEVMEAMGGREAWDATEELKWTFFGNRQHTWNKKEEKVKIYSPRGEINVNLDLSEMKGSASKGDRTYSSADSLDFFLETARKWWINDSYWLVMPFKLKDSGVTLKYTGRDTTTQGRSSDVLELTFANVGVTPDNKYLVYVDDSSRLVTQWDFYANYQDSIPSFKSPWPDYKQYGDLLLSGGSIRGLKLTDISVR